MNDVWSEQRQLTNRNNIAGTFHTHNTLRQVFASSLVRFLTT